MRIANPERWGDVDDGNVVGLASAINSYPRWRRVDMLDLETNYTCAFHNQPSRRSQCPGG